MTPLPTSVDVIVTHDGCFDGFTAHWLLQQRWPDAVYHPGCYGEPGPIGASGGTLVIADFSYPRDHMIELAGQWDRIIVLDHHQSAEQHVDLPDNIDTVFDMNRSGCGLVADWVGGQGRQLGLVDYVQDRDLWLFQLPYAREIHAVIHATPFTFDNWDRLDKMITRSAVNDAHHDDELATTDPLIASGRLLIQRDQIIIDELVPTARTITIDSHDIPATMSPYALGSQVAGALAAQPGVPFAAYYRDLPDRREYGLRSAPDGADVAVVAETYGGGGHPHAAGFRVPWGHPLAPTHPSPEYNE
jgi:oligoribonuclease NrnB/cAMP/cGMP phosphodiesterase (DHH superfamily)